MVWRIEGHSIASREYASKHEYLEEFVKPFGARFLASERFRPTNIRSVHADGNTVIVLWDGRGIATLARRPAAPVGTRRRCVEASEGPWLCEIGWGLAVPVVDRVACTEDLS